MTPRKVERGRQPGRGSETSDRPAGCSQSGQKRRSASRAHDEVDSKKGKTDSGSVGTTGGKDRRVMVGIDWQNTAIEDPTPKSSQHPSFKPDQSETSKSPPDPKIKSAVVAKSFSKGSTKALGSSRHRSQTPARSPKKKKEKKPPGFKSKDRELTEKEFVRDQAHHWIAAQANRLDPQGYVEETRSLRFFEHQQVLYGLEIIAIIDWARKYLDLGMRHPLPTLPKPAAVTYSRHPIKIIFYFLKVTI